MVSLDWQRTVAAPQVLPCLREGLAKATQPPAHLVSLEADRLPPTQPVRAEIPRDPRRHHRHAQRSARDHRHHPRRPRPNRNHPHHHNRIPRQSTRQRRRTPARSKPHLPHPRPVSASWRPRLGVCEVVPHPSGSAYPTCGCRQREVGRRRHGPPERTEPLQSGRRRHQGPRGLMAQVEWSSPTRSASSQSSLDTLSRNLFDKHV